MILLDSVGLNEVVTEGLEIHFKNKLSGLIF